VVVRGDGVVSFWRYPGVTLILFCRAKDPHRGEQGFNAFSVDDLCCAVTQGSSFIAALG
jgi:hypothetical protein